MTRLLAELQCLCWLLPRLHRGYRRVFAHYPNGRRVLCADDKTGRVTKVFWSNTE
jgi:hypothetical protein